jgi:uncharacterized protein (DUF1501 family)
MYKKYFNRRDFIRQFGLAALGTTVSSSMLNLRAIGSAFLNNSAADGDYKALVCFFLTGGNDSFNMLVPRGDAEYGEYAATRSNLALPQGDLIPIYPAGNQERAFGLHPAMPGVAELFNQQKLSFVCNTGSLIVPTTKVDYYQGNVPLPLGLYSHSDQIQQWQTASPHQRIPYGWGGELASLMQEFNDNENISMNISTSGTNVFQYGRNIVEFSINPFGGIESITGYRPGAESGFDHYRTQAIDALLNRDYNDIYRDTYAHVLKRARDGSREFQDAIGSLDELSTEFTNNYVSQSFRIIARTIQAREILGFKRQIFYVEYGGWDHHDGLLDNQAAKLAIVDNAMREFASALEELNVFDQVTTFSISEFARTLGSNGNGSDHAWGGNVMAMGGDINGGEMFGEYPTLEMNNPLEVGTGVLIPTLANDLYFAELALWFGVSKTDLPVLFPNIGNFYNLGSTMPPIGLMNV